MDNLKISRWQQLLIIIAAIVLIAADQWLKYIVFNKGGFFNWKNFFDIGFYQNYGTAFGIPIPAFILFPLIIIALLIISVRYFKYVLERYLWASISYSLIIGGAISNIIDRINYGYVVDYLHFSFGSTFNLADCMIVAGIIILIFQELKNKDQK